MKRILISTSLLVVSLVINSVYPQSVAFADDEKGRGYRNRPYKRYEAEPDKCQTNGQFLTQTFDQSKLQSEASNQMALELKEKGDFVEWTVDELADGLTIRFSLPDSNEGVGTKGAFAVYIDGGYSQNITLDSYWAWQYFMRNHASHADNRPSADKFARMRFDEAHLKLKKKIDKGGSIKLVKLDDNSTPYTIDFIELENVPDPVSFESITDANKIMYDSSVDISVFVRNNDGKTIYIPEGKHNVDDRIFIAKNGTKLIGAGMWYTELFFRAPSDNIETYARRGIETEASNVVIDGFYINTVNNVRYFNNDESYQVGKGFMGGFGTNSVIKNVWVEHFECGAWFGDYKLVGANNLLIEHSRFRNNYADGMNLCSGMKNAVVQYSSFRNNGDDDMASWSIFQMCENNTYRYNVAENNWRGSSIGFFGGKQNKAHHCVIIDPMEAGIRVTCDFPGTGFSADGYSKISDISIYKAGSGKGTPGVDGDLWGNRQGAVHLHSTQQYDMTNIEMSDIDIFDSKSNALFVASYLKQFNGLILKNIKIDTTGEYGIYYYQPQGEGRYCNISFQNIGAATNSNIEPYQFSLVEDCENLISIDESTFSESVVYADKKTIYVSSINGELVSVYDVAGLKRYASKKNSEPLEIHNLESGLYFVRIGNSPKTTKILLN